MTFDVKITGGLVYDGNGTAPVQADIAIKDGKIAEIGQISADAMQTIDAKGAIVTPGFLDLHTHYDGQVSWDDALAPSVNHGVTTAILGSCGVGFAPVREADHDRLIRLMEGVEDIPGTALAEGLTWEWESFPQYMDAIDSFPHAIDFAVHVTHDPLRVYVMGDRALHNQDATAEDITEMRRLTREALEAGAIGFSTGRSDVHRTADGEWTPASEAGRDELMGIAEALKGLDHGVLQAVNDFNLEREGDDFDEEFSLLEDFAKASDGHPFSLSLMQRDFAPKQWLQIIERAEKAKENGTDIRLQVAPRGIGVILGLQCTFHPFMGFPSYKKISHLPLDERVEAMRDPAFKAQLLTEESEKVAGDGTAVPPLADMLLKMIDFISCKMFKLGENPHYEQDLEDSMYKMAERAGVSPLEMIYDTLLEKDGREFIYFPIYNYTDLSFDNVLTMMQHPQALIGLSDGGAHVGTVCDASFPTYLLSYWTRDRERGDKIPRERAIQMLTSDIADYVGMNDRGRIEVGKKADINVIDIDALRLHPPHMVKDLPGGGQRLLQEATGYRATLVSGTPVIIDGALQEERPGRLVRMGQ